MQAPLTANALLSGAQRGEHLRAQLVSQPRDRVFAFLGLKPRIPPGGQGGQTAPEKLQRGIEFHHVSFRYPTGTGDALHDVSLIIRPGEKVALVGENGAGRRSPSGGKTTW